MDKEFLEIFMENEDFIISEAANGDQDAQEILGYALGYGYQNDAIKEGWAQVMPHVPALHPLQSIKNYISDTKAGYHGWRMRRQGKRLKKIMDKYREAKAVGADNETLGNIEDKFYKDGGDKLEYHADKFRKNRLDVIRRKTGQETKDNYDVTDKDGNKISALNLLNPKTVGFSMPTKDFARRHAEYYNGKAGLPDTIDYDKADNGNSSNSNQNPKENPKETSNGTTEPKNTQPDSIGGNGRSANAEDNGSIGGKGTPNSVSNPAPTSASNPAPTPASTPAQKNAPKPNRPMNSDGGDKSEPVNGEPVNGERKKVIAYQKRRKGGKTYYASKSYEEGKVPKWWSLNAPPDGSDIKSIDERFDITHRLNVLRQILHESSGKDETNSGIYAYLTSNGYNIKTMNKRALRALMLHTAQSDKYKEWYANNAYKIRQESVEPETGFEIKNNKETIMENNFTSFSQFLTENAIKEKSVEIVYNYVVENLDELLEMAKQGDEQAIGLLEHASEIEDYFIVE